MRNDNQSVLNQLGPLNEKQTEYLRVRKFAVVQETPPQGTPYLELGPVEDWFPATEIRFFRKEHSGRLASGGHPTNLPDTDLVRIIEEATSRGAVDDDYSTPPGMPIPIVVKDTTWESVVKFLLEKYG